MDTRLNHPRWRTISNSIVCGATTVTLIAAASVFLAPRAVRAEIPTAAELEAQIPKLREKRNTEPLAAALCNLANRYCEQGQPLKAVPLLKEAIELDQAAKRPVAQWQYSLYLIYRHEARRTNSLEENRNALAQLTLAKDAYAAENQPHDVARCLINMGWIERECGNFKVAIGHLEEALKIAQKAGLNDMASDVCNNLAATALAAGDSAAALAYQENAIKALAGMPADEALAAAWARLGNLQIELQKNDDALKSYNQAWEIESKVPKVERTAKVEGAIQHGLGECAYRQHKLPESISYYEKAIEALKDNEKDNIDLWIRAHTNLGISQADSNSLEAAGQSQRVAIESAKKANLPNLQLEATIQLACNSMLQGRSEQALQELIDSKALVDHPQVQPAQRGFYDIMVGRCYRSLGQSSAALKYYGDALREYERSKDPLRQAEVLSNIAVVHLDNMNQEGFQMNASRANELFTLLHDEKGAGTMDFNKAQFAFVSNHYESAIPLYEQAFTKLKNAHETQLAASAMRGKGFALLRAHKPDLAVKAFEQSLTMVSGTDNLEAQWDCNLGLGAAYTQLKETDKAIGYLKIAVELVEKERQQLTRDSFKTHNLDFRRACYLELADAYLSQNKLYEALEVAEKGKARAFLDLLANRRSREMDLSHLPGGTISGEKPLLVAMADLPGTRSVTFKAKEHALIEPTMISPVNAKPPDIGEIKSLLGKRKSTCLEYYLFKQKMVIWVVKPDLSISTVVVPIHKKDLAAELQELYQALLTPHKTPAEADALGHKRQKLLRSLYAKLIAPVAKDLPTSPEETVTIVPDQELFMVPFAALMTPDGTFLTEKHTLSYTPAIGVLRATQQLANEHKAEKTLLAFGNPVSPAAAAIGLPPLPYSEKEVKNIAQLFGAENTNLKIGSDATKSAFAAAAPTKSCLHLATHGLVDEEQPTKSALVLAPENGDDGMLTVGDILKLKDIKANLIVLSACQTGRGKITGDGVVGLSRAFIIAGTPSVIVSQWNVDDVVTEYLMRHFYQEYLSGKPKAQALRHAQIAALKALDREHEGEPITPNTVRANPRYWGAFQIIGEER